MSTQDKDKKQTPPPTMKADDKAAALAEENASNISKEEEALLQQTADTNPGGDDEVLQASMLDQTDEDGEPLNESADVSGDDLDIPGAEDADTSVEDEENDSFSLNDDKEDNIENRG